MQSRPGPTACYSEAEENTFPFNTLPTSLPGQTGQPPFRRKEKGHVSGSHTEPALERQSGISCESTICSTRATRRSKATEEKTIDPGVTLSSFWVSTHMTRGEEKAACGAAAPARCQAMRRLIPARPPAYKGADAAGLGEAPALPRTRGCPSQSGGRRSPLGPQKALPVLWRIN